MDAFDRWLSGASLGLIGAILVASFATAVMVGRTTRRWIDRRAPAGDDDGQVGYVVSAVLGLLALLLGFTFALAVDRFETRRALVLEEANAIGTTWLRAQLLPEPHRTRVRGLLLRYTDNRIALAKAPRGQAPELLATNDRLLDGFWTATAEAFPAIPQVALSSAFLASANQLIDLDASRKAARAAKVPAEVFLVLYAYVVVTAGLMGSVMSGLRARLSAAVFLGLLAMALLLIVDIDRPTGGGVREGQRPMEQLRATMTSALAAGGGAAAPPVGPTRAPSSPGP